MFSAVPHDYVFDDDKILWRRGPMAEGIQPREASDRLNIFMARFDDLWRKYVTYSGGEELFGLPITEYPDLQRIRKELSLLQKLYGLYNDVLEKVSGYYETPWIEINIDQINTELIDFQNKLAHSLLSIITLLSCAQFMSCSAGDTVICL